MVTQQSDTLFQQYKNRGERFSKERIMANTLLSPFVFAA